MSSRSKFAWLVVFVLILASLATNAYLIRVTLNLQNELNANAQETERAFELLAEREQALKLLEESSSQTDSKANKALSTANDIQSQIDSTSVMVGVALDYVAEQLEGIEEQEFTVVVPIDQEVPIDTTVLINEEVSIPFNEVIPINTNVSVPIELPVLGKLDLDVPINTSVPINLDLKVPITQEMPIKTVVPVQTDFPITISLKDTEIGTQLAQWRETLTQVRNLQNGNAAQE
ncbi:MAG: hypothetical protein ACPGWR_20000 [Ardenticatenaceae bacterium]